jgi:hypothetical protein
MSPRSKPIVTRTGDTFDITLPSYLCASWRFTPNNTRVKQMGKPRYGPLPPQTDKRGDHYVGRFAPTITTFKALAPGRCKIRAAVYQVMDPNRAIGHETIDIVIEPATPAARKQRAPR